MAGTVVLFDLPSKGRCACWSLNPWKTRLALNFKQIQYETKWIEYPDVKPTLESYGITPAESGAASHTIPAVLLPAGSGAAAEPLMDSKKIGAALEQRYPEPTMHWGSAMQQRVEAVFPKLMPALMPVFAPAIPDALLNPPSAEYFRRTRAERFGMPLDEFAEKKGGEKAWAAAQPAFDEVVAMLKEDPSGPFLMGKTPSYADFYIISAIKFFQCIGPEYGERLLSIDPVFRQLYDASQIWLQNDQ